MKVFARFVCATFLAALCAAVDVSTLKTVFNTQVQSDSSIQACAVAVFDTTGFNSKLSGAFGYADRVNGIPMLLDTGFRMNTLGEHLIVAAALKLVGSSILSLDSAIPTAYLPRQVALINPNFPSTSITLRMLMTHTSTLSDSSFETSSKTSPSQVADLQTFIVGYFITTSGGVNVLSSSLFTSTSATPGTTGAYSYAKINSALLTFIVEMAVIANPSLVTTGTYTALAYVREAILGPLGLADTFTLTLTGGFPTVSYPSGGAIFSNSLVADLSSAGTAISTRTIHPAYFSDYMTMSSTLDIVSLVRALFLVSSTTTTGSLTTPGQLMKQTKLTVTSSVTAATATGLGLLYFNGATMCASALAVRAVTTCPLTAANNIWGFVSSEQFSQVGYYCTDAGSTSNPTCVVTVHTFNDAGTTFKDASLSQAMAATALQLAIGDTSSLSQETVSSSSTNSLYGVWVFFGVLAVLVFVLAASYFTEYIIQPAPVIGGVPVPQSMMPQQVRLPTDTVFNRN